MYSSDKTLDISFENSFYPKAYYNDFSADVDDNADEIIAGLNSFNEEIEYEGLFSLFSFVF